jgi:arabinofuranosyltransferase
VASKKSLKLLAALIGLAGLGVLALQARHYLPFIADDALISLRYAQRLLTGRGLTWTEGPPVEGYSNLLWVLLSATLGLTGVDLIFGARLLGGIGMGAAIGAVVFASRPENLARLLPLTAAVFVLALSGPMAVWTIGGLEQPLLAGLLAWALVLCYSIVDDEEGRKALDWRLAGPSLLLGLISLTRPDGPLFAVAAGLGVLFSKGLKKDSFRCSLALVFFPALFYLGQGIFRFVYYRTWLPNTALAKLSLSWHRLQEGFRYVGGGFWSLRYLLLMILLLAICCIPGGRERKRIAFLIAPLVLWTLYVALIGGDIFPAHRHFVPVIVILSLLSAELLNTFSARRSPRMVAIGLGVLGLLSLHFAAQFRDFENHRAIEERWEWDGEVVGLFLKRAFGASKPVLAADPAGCLPYFSGLPSLDLLGLNDAYLARHPPKNFGQGYLGHELGDGAYVLGRKPDLIVFCNPRGGDRACFLSGVQMQQDPHFLEEYRLVAFEGRSPYSVRSEIWVKMEAGKIGIQRSDDEILIPGFLLATNGRGIATLDSQGRLGVTAFGGAPLRLEGFMPPEGSWSVSVEAAGEILKTALTIPNAPESAWLGEGGSLQLRIEGNEVQKMDLEVFPLPKGSLRVFSVRLKRIAPSL